MNKFKASFFIENRRRLAESSPSSLVVVTAHALLQYSADIAYPFRQDSNFWYLTGLNEPDLVLIIDTETGDSTLALPVQNDYQKEWDGALNFKELEKESGISNFCTRYDLVQKMNDAKVRGLKICYLAPAPERVEPFGFYANPARRILEEEIKKVDSTPTDIRMNLARLRQVKQSVEIQAIRDAIAITAEVLAEVKANLSYYKKESEVDCAISSGFLAHGGDGHSFESIVASGKNAATLHYVKNSARLGRDEMLLLDVGVSANNYSSDITRMFGLGSQTTRQLEVHKAVEDLQNEFFNMLKPGLVFKDFQKNIQKRTIEKMTELGVKNPEDRTQGFPHFLGIDAHDAGDYEAPLQEGTVLTVEPGIYLQDEGIGVRIEDDVLITKNGIEILSKNIPNDL